MLPLAGLGPSQSIQRTDEELFPQTGMHVGGDKERGCEVIGWIKLFEHNVQ
jgi:hypothetical protein